MVMSHVESEPMCAALEQVFLIFSVLCGELVWFFLECVNVAHSFVVGSHGCVCCFRFAEACFVLFLSGVI